MSAPQFASPPSPQAAPGGLRWRVVLPGDERAPRQVRRWVGSLLPACPARDDVALVAVELATNAIRFTASGQGGWLAVEITWHPTIVRVAVADGGAPAGPRLLDDPDSEHGRGLQVICGLSTRFGVCGGPPGRLVWADVPWAQPAAEIAEPSDGHETVIRDGEADLARRHPGIPAWFGRSTLQWWALSHPDGVLLTAPTASELTGLLGRAAQSSQLQPRSGRTGPPGHHQHR